jgi:hypothetical protein
MSRTPWTPTLGLLLLLAAPLHAEVLKGVMTISDAD